jgi:hypothetical protein
MLCVAHDEVRALALADAVSIDPRLRFFGCLPPGPQLIGALRARRPKLLLIDSPPPFAAGKSNLSAESILAEVIAADRTVAVVVRCPGATGPYATRLLEQGAHGCIDAGVSVATLIAGLRRALDGSLVVELGGQPGDATPLS